MTRSSVSRAQSACSCLSSLHSMRAPTSLGQADVSQTARHSAPGSHHIWTTLVASLSSTCGTQAACLHVVLTIEADICI